MAGCCNNLAINLPSSPAVRLIIQPQPSVNGARHSPLTLQAEPLPVGRNPRRRLWAVAVLFAPIAVFAVEPGGRHLEVCSSDAPVLDEECRHVVVFPELLGRVLDAFGYLEVTAVVEAS